MKTLKAGDICSSVCFTIVVIVCVYFCNGAEENEICSNPQKDLNFDAKWVHDNAPENGWYILYGNPVSRLHFAQLTQGRNLDKNEDLSKLCLKTVWDNTHQEIGGIYQGYGNLTAVRQCVHSEGHNITCGAVSTTNSSYSIQFKGHVAYVDTKDFRSHHIGVLCFENGDIGWVVSSIKRTLSDKDMATIIEELKKIGLKPEDQVKLYEDSCGD